MKLIIITCFVTFASMLSVKRIYYTFIQDLKIKERKQPPQMHGKLTKIRNKFKYLNNKVGSKPKLDLFPR